MTDQDFLKLLTAVVKVVKPFHAEAIEVTDMDIKLSETNIDSLDNLMIGIYMTDVFGIDEETAKALKPETPREMLAFLLQHATVQVTDVDGVIRGLK
jgi:hypothetical protein